jgi:hypothetical protein
MECVIVHDGDDGVRQLFLNGKKHGNPHRVSWGCGQR